MSRSTSAATVLIVLPALALLVAGCKNTSRATAGGSGAPLVQITERDFHIGAPAHVAAGDVTFRVHNNGPDQHEFIMVKVASPKLPFRTDGYTVDEESIQNAEPGSLVPGQPGATRDLTVHLVAGRYVLFCNMSGHYLGGMHQDLIVS